MMVFNARNLTDADAKTLEGRLSLNENDLVTRAKLVGYYGARQFRTPGAAAARAKHVLWLISNSPECGLLEREGIGIGPETATAYRKGKVTWLEHLKKNPENLLMLSHSASYFLIHDRDLAISSLIKARALDPENPEWPSRLGRALLLNSRSASRQTGMTSAVKALAAFQRAYLLSSSRGQRQLLPSLAKAALWANRQQEAEDYALRILDYNGDARLFHHGNTVLGLLAVENGDVLKASQHLIEAGSVTGSATLNSFGPDMTLARQLLEHGQSNVVLEYLSLCSRFWEHDRGRLDSWVEVIEQGGIPDFGSNERY
jgi:hypothetical protein